MVVFESDSPLKQYLTFSQPLDPTGTPLTSDDDGLTLDPAGIALPEDEEDLTLDPVSVEVPLDDDAPFPECDDDLARNKTDVPYDQLQDAVLGMDNSEALIKQNIHLSSSIGLLDGEFCILSAYGHLLTTIQTLIHSVLCMILLNPLLVYSLILLISLFPPMATG